MQPDYNQAMPARLIGFPIWSDNDAKPLGRTKRTELFFSTYSIILIHVSTIPIVQLYLSL